MKQILILILCVFCLSDAFAQRKVYRSMEEALRDPLEVREISFYFDDITTLPESILKLKNLEAITIDRCPKLNLRQAIGVLAKLDNLQSFSFTHNGLTSVPVEIVNLQHLTELALIDNKLTALPPAILKLNHLRRLDLSENQSLDFNQAFELLAGADSLKQLVLENNKLTDLSSNITKMVQLDDLLLGNNKFADVPEQVKGMPIKYLDLSSNMLELLNIRKGDLQHLTGINLDQNEFRELPPELLLLPNLHKVSMLGNLIAIIPKWIKNVRGLNNLDLSSNVLTELPVELSQLPNLREVNFSGNHLTAAGLAPLFDMPWLAKLELHRNDITHVDPRIKNLSNLRELDLGNNPLKQLPPELINLEHLQWLSLGMLPTLNWDDTFNLLAQMPNLSKLSLFFNSFNKVPNGLLKLDHVSCFIVNGNGFDKDEKEKLKSKFPLAEVVF